MLTRIRQMLIKEFLQVFRDPKMKMVIFVMPVVQLLIFGYAATTDVHNVPTALYDLDNSVASRDLISRFVQSGYFSVAASVQDMQQGQQLMDRNKVQTILHINHGFQEQLQAGRTAELQIIIDGTDSNTASIVLSYGSRIAQEYSRNILLRSQTRLKGTAWQMPGTVDLQTRAWFNENLESRNFFVPGVIAILVLITTLMLTSMAIVREKEIGTMEQVMVTPITPMEFILGKTLPFAVIGFADVLIITVVGVFWFQVPIRGSILLLLACTALYLMTTISIGLLISTIARTQQQALMATFFFGLPAILLSGFMFPIENMPQVIQYLTYLNPLRYFVVIIRGIFLKGVGLDILWPQMVVLGAMGLAMLVVASRKVNKTLA